MDQQHNSEITGHRRIEYLDCVKGLAILCITFTHFEKGVIPDWLNVWIGLFMITTFYFTSGWIFSLKNKIDSPQTIAKKRFRQLGIPYVWFTLIIIIFELLWCVIGLMHWDILWRDIYKSITLRGIGTLWFLPVLLFSEYIFCALASTKRPIVYGSIIFALSILCGYVYDQIWAPMLETKLSYKLIDSPIKPIVMALCAWPIIAIGYFSCKYSINFIHSKKNEPLKGIIGIFIVVLSILFIVYPPFNIPFLNVLISNFLPVIGFVLIFKTLKWNRIIKLFSYWGKNSLILMCTHFSITMEILIAFDANILGHKDFVGWRTIIYFTIAILITYPIVYLFNSHLKFMLGKR